MKEYKKIMVERIVLSKTTCDKCKSDCTNTFFDIEIKTSFCEDRNFVETICYDCYEKIYKDIIIENRNKIFLKRDAVQGDSE